MLNGEDVECTRTSGCKKKGDVPMIFEPIKECLAISQPTARHS